MKPSKVRQLLREGDLGGINMISSPTMHRAKPLTRNLRIPADEENAGDWSERDSDATYSTDGDAETKKNKNVWKGQPGDEPRQVRKLARIRLANLSFLERVSVSHGTEAKYKKQVEQFLSFADEEKLALVADDEVDAATALYLNMSYSQGRPASDGEVLLAGLPFFQPSTGEL